MKKYSTKKYLITLGIVIYVPLLIIALFNVSQDPFGLYGVNRITGYNHFISDAFYRSSNHALKMNRLENHIRDSKGPNLIIGTSTMLWGMNTCNVVGLERAGLYGLPLNDAFGLATVAIESEQYEQIFIELADGNFNSQNSLPSTSIFNLNNLFGYNTLQISIRNFTDSRVYKQYHKINCYSYSTTTNPIENENLIENKTIKSPKSLQLPTLNTQSLDRNLINLLEQCSIRNSNSIQIRFYLSPIHDLNPNKDLVLATNQRLQNYISRKLPSTVGSCTFDILELKYDNSSHDILSDPVYWGDLAHYDTELGQLIIKQLFQTNKDLK